MHVVFVPQFAPCGTVMGCEHVSPQFALCGTLAVCEQVSPLRSEVL